MAEVRISDLQERADIDLTDFFAVDNATSTRKLAMTTLLSHIADAYQTKTDDSLETTSDTVVGAINEVHTELTKNIIGNSVSLISYNSVNNMYTFPSDGYLSVGAGNEDTEVQVHLNGAVGSLSTILISSEYVSGGTYGQLQSVFVRKGMRVFCEGTLSQNYSVTFRPLT